jgi:hypothetical protein
MRQCFARAVAQTGWLVVGDDADADSGARGHSLSCQPQEGREGMDFGTPRSGERPTLVVFECE